MNRKLFQCSATIGERRSPDCSKRFCKHFEKHSHTSDCDEECDCVEGQKCIPVFEIKSKLKVNHSPERIIRVQEYRLIKHEIEERRIAKLAIEKCNSCQDYTSCRIPCFLVDEVFECKKYKMKLKRKAKKEHHDIKPKQSINLQTV